MTPKRSPSIYRCIRRAKLFTLMLELSIIFSLLVVPVWHEGAIATPVAADDMLADAVRSRLVPGMDADAAIAILKEWGFTCQVLPKPMVKETYAAVLFRYSQLPEHYDRAISGLKSLRTQGFIQKNLEVISYLSADGKIISTYTWFSYEGP